MDYLRNSSEPGVRTHQTSLLFYLIAALALLSSLILNLYQVLKRKIPDYAVHRLFGASDAFLYARMLLFALFYHAIPLLGTIYVVTVNRMATPATLMAAAVVLLASLLGVTGAVHKQFCTQFSRELRRE